MTLSAQNTISGNGGRNLIPLGQFGFVIQEITLDNSYPSNGYVISPSDLGFRNLDTVVPLATSAGYIPVWDKANQKLKIFWTGAGLSGVLAEVTNATNLSAVKVYLLATGQR